MSLQEPTSLLFDAIMSELPGSFYFDDLQSDYEDSFSAALLAYRRKQHLNTYTMDRVIVEREDVLRGVTDIQGLSWLFGSKGREECLARRRIHTPYNRMSPKPTLPKGSHEVNYTETYYDFRYTDTSNHCSHNHFQLRNLVAMTSKNDVYYLNNNAVMQWSPQRRQSRLLLADHHVPYRITAMAAREDHLLVAGEDGNFSMLNLQTCAVPEQGSLTDRRHVEVNSIEMSTSRSGASHAYITTNDHVLRNIDLQTLNVLATFSVDWFANYAAQSMDKHLICVVGDDVDAKIFSVNSCEAVATLRGHKKYAFACAWSPDGRLVATGSDDMTVRLYDTRRLDQALHILSNDISSEVRSLRYSDDGRFLYLAEDYDALKIIDTSSGYTCGQAIDCLGFITGFAFSSPDAESLFIGTSGKPFASLIEFEQSSTLDDDGQDQDFYWT